jgi:Flp pilus assembly protein TadD
METPGKVVERIAALLEQAREHLGAGRLDPAKAAAREAAGLDRCDARPEELLAEIMRASGDSAAADRHDAAAKNLRLEAWQREVEAEARGHHEWMGTVPRHETSR